MSTELLSAIGDLSVAALLAAAVLAFSRGWIVRGTDLDRARAECVADIAKLETKVATLEAKFEQKMTEATVLMTEQGRVQQKTIDALQTALQQRGAPA